MKLKKKYVYKNNLIYFKDDRRLETINPQFSEPPKTLSPQVNKKKIKKKNKKKTIYLNFIEIYFSIQMQHN